MSAKVQYQVRHTLNDGHVWENSEESGADVEPKEVLLNMLADAFHWLILMDCLDDAERELDTVLAKNGILVQQVVEDEKEEK